MDPVSETESELHVPTHVSRAGRAKNVVTPRRVENRAVIEQYNTGL